MEPLDNPLPDKSCDGDAAKLVASWRRAQSALEAERLQRLRNLSERDAAKQFDRLLQLSGSYPLRPTSGLVEQQRILTRLRERN